jgi:glycosyltransferase 2 family protein
MTDMPTNIVSQRKPTNLKQLIWRGMSILVTVVLLIILINNVKWAEFGDLIGRVSIISLFGALFSYLMLNVFRAIRFRTLLDKEDTPLRVLIPITLYHNFLVRLLPFKLGEISYIVLLRSRLNYSMEEGVSSLFGARILELLIIVVVFAVGILLSGEQFTIQRDSLMAVVAVVFISSVFGLYFAGTLIRVMLNIFNTMLKRITSHKIALIEMIESKLLDIAIEFDRIRNPRLFISALGITCFTYTTSFMTNYILLRAVGLEADIPVVITIISIGMFASAFPFSVSGFGVVELSWLFGLVQFAGYGESEATAIGFMLHGFQVIAASLYGLVGYILIHATPPLQAHKTISADPIQQQESTS